MSDYVSIEMSWNWMYILHIYIKLHLKKKLYKTFP